MLCSSVILWIHSGAGFLKIFRITQPLVLILVKVLEPPKTFQKSVSCHERTGKEPGQRSNV